MPQHPVRLPSALRAGTEPGVAYLFQNLPLLSAASDPPANPGQHLPACQDLYRSRFCGASECVYLQHLAQRMFPRHNPQSADRRQNMAQPRRIRGSQSAPGRNPLVFERNYRRAATRHGGQIFASKLESDPTAGWIDAEWNQLAVKTGPGRDYQILPESLELHDDMTERLHKEPAAILAASHRNLQSYATADHFMPKTRDSLRKSPGAAGGRVRSAVRN